MRVADLVIDPCRRCSPEERSGHQADEGDELLGGLEATEVADLGDERERGQRVDAAQAAQPGDERPPRLHVGVEGLLLRGELEALLIPGPDLLDALGGSWRYFGLLPRVGRGRGRLMWSPPGTCFGWISTAAAPYQPSGSL